MAGLKLPGSADRVLKVPSSYTSPLTALAPSSSAFKRTNKSSPSTIGVDQTCHSSSVDQPTIDSSYRSGPQGVVRSEVKLQPMCMRQQEFWAIDEPVKGFQPSEGIIKMKRQPEYYEEDVSEEVLVFDFEEPKPILSSRNATAAPKAAPAVEETVATTSAGSKRDMVDEQPGSNLGVAGWFSWCLGRAGN